MAFTGKYLKFVKNGTTYSVKLYDNINDIANVTASASNKNVSVLSDFTRSFSYITTVLRVGVNGTTCYARACLTTDTTIESELKVPFYFNKGGQNY